VGELGRGGGTRAADRYNNTTRNPPHIHNFFFKEHEFWLITFIRRKVKKNEEQFTSKFISTALKNTVYINNLKLRSFAPD
jgi:hypothetical protein